MGTSGSAIAFESYIPPSCTSPVQVRCSVRAWEIEASLVHYDVAWYLYGELWDISSAMQSQLSAKERLALLDDLMRPILQPDVSDAVKSALLVTLFQAVLAARILPLFEDTAETE